VKPIWNAKLALDNMSTRVVGIPQLKFNYISIQIFKCAKAKLKYFYKEHRYSLNRDSAFFVLYGSSML